MKQNNQKEKKEKKEKKESVYEYALRMETSDELEALKYCMEQQAREVEKPRADPNFIHAVVAELEFNRRKNK